MTDQIAVETADLVEQHLPDGSDQTVLVLKAHLLVEEQLIKLMQASARKPECIDTAKLGFPQKVAITQAFAPVIVPERWFKAALLLNSIRNKLAHQMSPKDLESLERDFTQHIFEASLDLSKDVLLPGLTHQEKFRTALVMLVVALAAARSAIPEILGSKAHRSAV